MAERERRFFWSVLLGDAILLLCALCGLTGAFLSLYGGPKAAPWADTEVLARCAADRQPLLVWAAGGGRCGGGVAAGPVAQLDGGVLRRGVYRQNHRRPV